MSWTTLEDTSPFIYYDDQWISARAGGVAGTTLDTQEMRYSNTSWHLTRADGAKAIIKWVGRNIEIFGSLRGNHGYYSVMVDGGEKVMKDGLSGVDKFQVSLFVSQDLEEGDHEIVITNEPFYGSSTGFRTYLDIDFVSIQGTPIQPDKPSEAKADTTPPPPQTPSLLSSISTSSSSIVQIPTSPQPQLSVISSTTSSFPSTPVSSSTSSRDLAMDTGGVKQGQNPIAFLSAENPSSSTVVKTLPHVSQISVSSRVHEVFITTATPNLRRPSMMAVMADSHILRESSSGIRALPTEGHLGGILVVLLIYYTFLRVWRH